MKTFIDCDCADGCYACHGTGTVEAYECVGRNCDAIADSYGGLCGRCQAKLDNAIDHYEFPDRVMR